MHRPGFVFQAWEAGGGGLRFGSAHPGTNQSRGAAATPAAGLSSALCRKAGTTVATSVTVTAAPRYLPPSAGVEGYGDAQAGTLRRGGERGGTPLRCPRSPSQPPAPAFAPPAETLGSPHRAARGIWRARCCSPRPVSRSARYALHLPRCPDLSSGVEGCAGTVREGVSRGGHALVEKQSLPGDMQAWALAPGIRVFW